MKRTPQTGSTSTAIIALLLAGGISLGQDAKVKEQKEAPELSLTIAGPVEEVFQGDPIPIEFTITNVGESVYTYSDRNYDRSGRMDEYELRATLWQTKEAGTPVPDPRAAWTGGIMGGLSGMGTIEPGESFQKTIELNRWALITEAGNYSIEGIYHGGPLLGAAVSVVSQPITVVVKKRSEQEMKIYLEALDKKLRAAMAEKNDFDDLIRQLAYTCRMDAMPAIIDSMYASSSNTFWQAEALVYYLPDKERVAKAIYESGMKRGLAPGMQYVLSAMGQTEERLLFPMIQKSLEKDHPECWSEGASMAQRYPDDRYTKRLVGIARSEKRPPIQVIYALAANRTDESVEALKELIEHKDNHVREWTERAVRHAYIYRHANSPGRAFEPTDFPMHLQIKEPDEPAPMSQPASKPLASPGRVE